MKIDCKIILLILCISLLPLSTAYAVSIRDNTYLVFVRTPDRLWADQFEFDAGDVYRAFTTRRGELSGTWIETELFDSFLFSLNWFQAYVEKSEESTTTTTTPTPTTTTIPTGLRSSSGNSVTPQQVKFDINIWGIALTSFIPLPNQDDPLNPILLGFSFMSGYGNYLGADTTFMGFAGFQGGGGGGGGGGDANFGSISPDDGEQESTVLNIEITCNNTTFKDDGVNDIIFIPGDGLVVKNITVQDNLTIEFDLEIAVNAPLGDKTVVVSWDDPPKTVSSDSVDRFFTVTAKTN